MILDSASNLGGSMSTLASISLGSIFTRKKRAFILFMFFAIGAMGKFMHLEANMTKLEADVEQDVVRAYLQSLENKSYTDVLNLFSPDAIVSSPLYGKVEASRFYKDLFEDTESSKITIKNIFLGTDNTHTAAVHFIYAWVMQDGALNQFDCVDVFEFDPESSKIVSLTIIYDTYNTRKNFEKLHDY